MLHLFFAPALAQEPTGTVTEDGAVEVRCTLPASPEEVRALLADPVVAGRLSPETLSITPTSRGPCTELGMRVKGPFDPIALTTLRCPTPRGWKYSLVKSDTLTNFEAEWSLAPRDGGTEVVYRVRSEVNLPVPRSLVRRSILASARETLDALVARLSTRK